MRRHVYLTGLVVALLGVGVVHGQGPAASSSRDNSLPPPVAINSPASSVPSNASGAYNSGAASGPTTGIANGPGRGPADGPPVYGPGLSEWIKYPRGCDCCGPVGKHGQIRSEVYARSGISFPTGGGLVGDNATPGFWVQGGLRTLFFNKANDTAWVVDGGLSGSWYDIRNSPPVNMFNVEVQRPSPQGQTNRNVQDILTVRASSVSYTLLNLSVGQEYYLWGGPDCSCDSRFRFGWDFGGRYGTSKMIAVPLSGVIFDPVRQNQNGDNGNFAPGDRFRHRIDVVGGYFLALHADLEIPTGCCIFFVGGRVEYGALWSDILQSQNDTNVQLFNVLLNCGLRF